MAWALERARTIGRSDPGDGAAEVRALRIERQQSVRVVDQEELALNVSQWWSIDRRHILGAHGQLTAEGAGLVRPEQQPCRSTHQCEHRSHRAQSGIAQELATIRAHRETSLAVSPKKGKKRRGDPSYNQAEQRSQNHEHARVLCQAGPLPAIHIACPSSCRCTFRYTFSCSCTYRFS